MRLWYRVSLLLDERMDAFCYITADTYIIHIYIPDMVVGSAEQERAGTTEFAYPQHSAVYPCLGHARHHFIEIAQDAAFVYSMWCWQGVGAPGEWVGNPGS